MDKILIFCEESSRNFLKWNALVHLPRMTNFLMDIKQATSLRTLSDKQTYYSGLLGWSLI